MLIASDPLLSVSGRHFIGDAVRRCGLVNVFDAAPGVVVRISPEGLLATRPELIVLVDEAEREGVARRLSDLLPEARLLRIDPDLTARPGPRLLQGTLQLCEGAHG